jgi:type IV pilus assembly protein PilQ
MSSFFRLLGLTLFGAAGVALAVWLATSVPPTSVARGRTIDSTADSSARESSAAATTADAYAPTPTPPGGQEQPEPWTAEPRQPETRVADPRTASDTELPRDLQQPVENQRIQPPAPLPSVVPISRDSDSWPLAPQPAITRVAISEAGDPAALDKLLQQLPEVPPQDEVSPGTPRPPSAGVELPAPAQLDEPEDAPEPARHPAAPPSPGRSPKTEIKASGPGDRNVTIHIQDTDIREVLDMLSEQGGMNILASRNVQGKVSASLTNVDIDTALAAILKSTGFVARREGKFIYVGNPQDFRAMEQTGDRIGTRVYRPNYVKAADLQGLIVPLLTPQVGTVSVSKPAQIGIAADSGQVGGDGFAGTEALLVHDYEAVLIEVDQVFQEIDKRPTQVAIEAMILSVKLNDVNSRGVDFQFLRNNPNIVFATGTPVSDLSQVSLTNGGLQFGFLDSGLGAFLSALETIGDTNVIATPRLMCLNKHRAEILIGAKLGYITKTLTQTTTAETVDFLEVGTQLRLRPFISSDGLIRMEVHPELSTGEVQVEDGMTIPDKQVTEVTTNVMVRDGCTVIIGGLMQDELDKTASQVPLLGSAPGIGWLFRHTTETTARSEIIILITPHIVYEPETCREGQCEAAAYHDRQAVYADHMSPIGTRYLGRKYLRLAERAWHQGDRREALHLVNVSIGFDPSSRPAIDLRHAICESNCGGALGRAACPSTPLLMSAAPTPEALDGHEISPWLLDGLEDQGPQGRGFAGPASPGSTCPGSTCPGSTCLSPTCGANVHPLDAGQAGHVLRIERPGSMP